MNRSAQVKFSSKILETTIKKSIKKALASKGISTTNRQGNKELKFLVGKIAQHYCDSLEQATNIGEKLGEKITEISQKQGKQNLDGGVIRQLSYQKELYSLIGLPAEQSQAVDRSSPQSDVTSATTPQVIEEKDTPEQPSNEEAPSEIAADTPEQPSNEQTPSEIAADTPEQPSNEQAPSEAADTPEQPSNEQAPSEIAADTPEHSEPNDESLIHG